jgi:hypothetical protein
MDTISLAKRGVCNIASFIHQTTPHIVFNAKSQNQAKTFLLAASSDIISSNHLDISSQYSFHICHK